MRRLTLKTLNKKTLLAKLLGPVEKLSIKQCPTWQYGPRSTETLISQSNRCKNTHSIANTEINVSMNRQFSVFSVSNFTRNNPQTTYLVALKIKETLTK